MIFNKFCNRFINKITNILIFAILILIAFFIGLNTANAETIPATMWGTALENHINSLTSTTTYNYTDYNSDSIREFIYEKSNEQFFDNTYNHQKEFYRDYNYVVMAYSQTTIRVFVQNYNRVVAYQGFQTMPVEPYFYFANMTIQYRAGTSTYWRTGVNAIYSYYIDINYNTKSYTFSDNNPLTDLNFYLLGTGYHYKDSNKPFGSTDINMKLLDSFNGNFAWIETWNEIENTEALWYQCSGYTTTSTILGYFNSIVDFPELEYVSTPFPDDETPDDGGGESTSPDYSNILDTIEDWLSKIEGNTNSSKSFLEGISETLGKIGQSIGDGLNDLIEGISGTLDDIFDWFTGGFNDLVSGISDILNDLFGSITDFFADFFDKLIDALIGLIVPDNLDKVKELYENIKSKLGFIVEVPELLITFMFDLLNSEWEKVTSLTFPAVDIFGYNFWDEKEIDLLPILNVIEPYKIYTDIACVGLMIIGCINLYEKFTGGDN